MQSPRLDELPHDRPRLRAAIVASTDWLIGRRPRRRPHLRRLILLSGWRRTTAFCSVDCCGRLLFATCVRFAVPCLRIRSAVVALGDSGHSRRRNHRRSRIRHCSHSRSRHRTAAAAATASAARPQPGQPIRRSNCTDRGSTADRCAIRSNTFRRCSRCRGSSLQQAVEQVSAAAAEAAVLQAAFPRAAGRAAAEPRSTAGAATAARFAAAAATARRFAAIAATASRLAAIAATALPQQPSHGTQGKLERGSRSSSVNFCPRVLAAVRSSSRCRSRSRFAATAAATAGSQQLLHPQQVRSNCAPAAGSQQLPHPPCDPQPQLCAPPQSKPNRPKMFA